MESTTMSLTRLDFAADLASNRTIALSIRKNAEEVKERGA